MMFHRLNQQLVAEHFRGTARGFVLTALVIAATFTLYGLYGGLTRTYGMTTETVSATPLKLPADAMIYEPAWQLLTVSPPHDLAQVDSLPGVAANEASAVSGQAVPVETASGVHMLWGFGPDMVNHLLGLELTAGEWPTEPQTVVVSEPTNLQVGDHVTVQFLHPFTQQTSRLSLEVVGIYRADWSMELPWISVASTTESLLGVTQHNIRFGFQVVEHDTRYNRRRTPVDLPGSYRQALIAWTSRVPVIPLPNPTNLPAWARSFGGAPLFDTTLVGPAVITPATVARNETAMQRRMGYALVPVMTTVLSVVLAILTLVVVNVFLGEQRTIGIWRALGVATSEIRNLYFVTIVGVGLVGTILGLLLYLPMLYVVNRLLGTPLPIPWSSSALWVALLLALGAWGAHVAGALYTASSIRSYLNNETAIDWWALIRIGEH